MGKYVYEGFHEESDESAADEIRHCNSRNSSVLLRVFRLFEYTVVIIT